MQGAGRRVFARLAGGALALTITASAAGAPLLPSISHCDPGWGPDGAGSLGPGYSGPGFYNEPEHRSLVVHFSYRTESPTDDVQAAIDDTDRVELCVVPSGGNVDCPGTGKWLVFDRATGVGSILPANVFTDPHDVPPTVNVAVPHDWADSSHDDELIVPRVNGVPVQIPGNITSYGACPAWVTRAPAPAGGLFDVISPTSLPFQTGPGTTLDPCMDALLVQWRAPFSLISLDPTWNVRNGGAS